MNDEDDHLDETSVQMLSLEEESEVTRVDSAVVQQHEKKKTVIVELKKVESGVSSDCEIPVVDKETNNVMDRDESETNSKNSEVKQLLENDNSIAKVNTEGKVREVNSRKSAKENINN